MTYLTHDRLTIIVPEDMIEAVNAALGLSMQVAGWRDDNGNNYAAASYLATGKIISDDIPGLPVVIFSRETPLALQVGYVNVVSGRDGANALAALGLTASELDLS